MEFGFSDVPTKKARKRGLLLKVAVVSLDANRDFNALPLRLILKYFTSFLCQFRFPTPLENTNIIGTRWRWTRKLEKSKYFARRSIFDEQFYFDHNSDFLVPIVYFDHKFDLLPIFQFMGKKLLTGFSLVNFLAIVSPFFYPLYAKQLWGNYFKIRFELIVCVNGIWHQLKASTGAYTDKKIKIDDIGCVPISVENLSDFEKKKMELFKPPEQLGTDEENAPTTTPPPETAKEAKKFEVSPYLLVIFKLLRLSSNIFFKLFYVTRSFKKIRSFNKKSKYLLKYQSHISSNILP